MNSALQLLPLPAFGFRPPASSRRRTPKSRSFCSLHRFPRILPTFDFQLSTFNRPCPHQSVPGLPGSPVTRHRSLFSCTYELPIFYLLCFDIHASDGGSTPHPTHLSRFVRGTANPSCAARRASLSTFNCQLSTSAWENRISNMNRPRNFRVYFLLAALALGGLILLLREHRPSFLRPGLRLYAYVTTADGASPWSTSSSSKPFRTCTSARAFPDCASIPRAPKSLASAAPAATSGFLTPISTRSPRAFPWVRFPTLLNFPGMANGFTPRLPATTRSWRWTPNRTPSSGAPPPATTPPSPASRRTGNPSWW